MVSAVTICMSPRRVWYRCNLPCVYAFRLISIARYAFKSPRICFRGTKQPWTCCLLAFYIVRRARLRLQLFASSVGRSLSRITYFVLVRLSSEIPWLSFEKAIRLSLRDILMFLAAIWSSLCFSCSMYRFISPVAVYAQVCWLFCVFYMPLFGLVQALFSDWLI